MKFSDPFRTLTVFERSLWVLSLMVTVLSYAVSFALSGRSDVLTLAASLIGVTALIFVSKGHVFGQVLTVVFSVFYGVISFFFRYYGEMITYLCMTSPIAIAAVVSWARHPFAGSSEVEVSRLTRRKTVLLVVLTGAVTVAFYFILKALGNANLLISTVSIATSFAASYLTLFRSPYYAAAYSCNDIVLIILWTLAAADDISYVPMIFCFLMFLINDLYGFVNWRRMKKRQSGKLT